MVFLEITKVKSYRNGTSNNILNIKKLRAKHMTTEFYSFIPIVRKFDTKTDFVITV